MTFMEPEVYVRNFLRGHLTDYNSANRGGKQWIFDGWPLDDLSPSSFPRVAVVPITQSGARQGIGDDQTLNSVSIQIDVIVHRDTANVTVTHTDEAVGTIGTGLTLDRLPNAVTEIAHDTTAFGTLTLAVNESDFTSPSVDEVEYSISTGKLNFNSTDLTSYSGEAITATYTEFLRGMELAKRIARDIGVALRSQWRNDTLLEPLFEPEEISGPAEQPYDQGRGWFRVTLEYRFKVYNAGEEV